MARQLAILWKHRFNEYVMSDRFFNFWFNLHQFRYVLINYGNHATIPEKIYNLLVAISCEAGYVTFQIEGLLLRNSCAVSRLTKQATSVNQHFLKWTGGKIYISILYLRRVSIRCVIQDADSILRYNLLVPSFSLVSNRLNLHFKKLHVSINAIFMENWRRLDADARLPFRRICLFQRRLRDNSREIHILKKIL